MYRFNIYNQSDNLKIKCTDYYKRLKSLAPEASIVPKWVSGEINRICPSDLSPLGYSYTSLYVGNNGTRLPVKTRHNLKYM